MKISRINPYHGESKTVAFLDIETEEGIIIKGLTIIDGPNGLFVAVPSKKGKDDQYYDTIILTKELKKELNEMAIAKYNELMVQQA